MSLLNSISTSSSKSNLAERPSSPIDSSSRNSQHIALAEDILSPGDGPVKLTGYSLTLAEVVAVARGGKEVVISDDNLIRKRIDDSVEFLKSKLTTSIYGVTTGFGGSADTRTEKPLALQISLLEHQLCGILPSSFDGLDLGQGMENAMPEAVVRGAMIIRVNSLSRGHSAVRLEVLETLIQFIHQGITPVVPLRGSISASGDLSPLSYIAGAITGHPDVKVISRLSGKPVIMSAPEALSLHKIKTVVLGPKEGLGLVNGTAVSSSMATLALHDSHFLALLSTGLTAMTVEALVGQAGSFNPFIHDVARPHPGQIQVARNIRNALEGSKLAVHHEEEVGVKEDEGVLRQDRYPLRTSPQWLSPVVSDLISSHATLFIELNSTTDNPLIDLEAGLIHHTGNFQASSVTNTMEKTRIGLQQIGKLNYSQMTELANGTMNRGLPSCLAGDEPSTNYHVKGLDIAAASYTSELGFLANVVSSHVQPAEMSNQAVNSLALISARKTVEANDVLAMLLSTHLYCACQALDLRYLQVSFHSQFDPTILASLTEYFSNFLDARELQVLAKKLTGAIMRRLEATTSVDLEPRWIDAFSHVTSIVLDALSTTKSTENPLPSIAKWRSTSATSAVALARKLKNEFFDSMDSTSPTSEYLGKTKLLYSFVRNTLGVKARRGDVYHGKQEKTIGSNVSLIYNAIKDGRINSVLVEMFA